MSHMYALASSIEDLPIISLQTGEVVAAVRQPIIELATLTIQALRCSTGHRTPELILMVRDIRQFASDCLIIDSENELANPNDIVRLTALLKANYTPLRKPVLTDTGRKLGQVEDCTIDLESYRIQKLHIRRSFWQSWLGADLLVDRSQILDITPSRIIVRDAIAEAPLLSTDPLPEVRP